MFAVCGRHLDMAGVQGMRRGDVDGLHIGVGTQGLHTVDTWHTEVAFKLDASQGLRVGGTDQLNARVVGQRGQHEGEGAAQARDA
jgi:hypothetical protein